MLDTKALHRIGIDTEEGIAYCADDPEFYEDMLRAYLQESEGRAADLRRFYALQDWSQYGLCAHTVKSTSKMIGAKAVSELAREMELACRSRDAASVLTGHDRFLREYTDLADGLRTVMQTSE